MSFHTEFPDFDPATLPTLPAGWRDTSWRNDTCPSFNAGNGKVVFIDYADTTLREWPDGKRFTVHCDPELTDDDDILLETDDWETVLAFVSNTDGLPS